MADLPVVSIRWQLDSVSAPPPGRRSVASATVDTHLARVVGDRFEVEKEFRATSPQRRGAEPLPPMDVTIPAEPGAVYLLAVRQEGSGALSFHAPKAQPERRGIATGATQSTVTFEVQFAEDVNEGVRRSIISKVVKAVVLKAVGKFADLTVPWIGSKVEEFIWNKKGLQRGWLQVTPDTLKSGNLQPADFSKIANTTDRCLLLLHGTFSNAAGAFQGLTNTKGAGARDFFSALTPVYGDRIFAFNHFTVSQTPEQNAQDLISTLPKQAKFDVITHSRGGLVLRNLVERQAALGATASNFQLGKAVLVASPNIGTQLATADRFESLISWWTNILELFPENPFSTTIEYIGEALNFIARHVVDALPGLESMDMAGSQISTLNQPPGPPVEAYSTICSNYQPKGSVLARMLDLGIDGIFGTANDLVVPTTGAWKTDAHADWVAANRIGCFGLNLASASAAGGVIHTTYFSQPETVDFLANTLLGQSLGLAVVDLDANPPFFLRRSVADAIAANRVAAVSSVAEPLPTSRESQGFLPTALNEADNILQLFLISPDDHLPADAAKLTKGRTAILLATYRNARVVETIYLRRPKKLKATKNEGDETSEADPGATDYHWNKIIGINESIKSYVDGGGQGLPSEDDLLDLGVNLFNAMFPGSVRRLYDVARVDRERAADHRRLDIVITSMINWVADKPWEFAYDPNRQSFLATEAANFTRNVLTAVPADEFQAHPGKPLRILVVVAQPVGMGLLSAGEEEQVVRRGFQELEELGLVQVEYMLRTCIEELHERLRNPDVDILHFIGHGTYKDDKKEGYLVFESPDGGMQLISAENLRQVLCQRGIRLLFLNACETGMVGRAQMKFDFNRGVAPKLVAGGIPVLVANQYKVLDVSATEFAKHFYRWLALGSTVGDAAREARVAVNYSIAGETIDWAVPVVYARNPGRMIYTPEEKDHVAALWKGSHAQRTAPCRGFKGVKVGLWDVNHVLPRLDSFAEQLNAAQTGFCFRTVDVSAPLGTWRRRAIADKGAYINGEEVARKLQDHVVSLGVDHLICITSFGLADRVDSGLALWNQDPNQRVAIISTELMLDEGSDPGDAMNRFLADLLVSALCGETGHTIPPTDCPNYYPEKIAEADPKERRVTLSAAHKLCPQCCTELAKKLPPDQIEAMNKILTTW
ncbi:MAG TPA: CHAT domain-containing protein [Candidatus Limnocylindrales bacterium]|nr:CHAT domain-containing protein [Candidatus Limnocylindrales bacterium]